MSEEEKSEGFVEPTLTPAGIGGEEGDIVKIEQFLDVFEVRKVDGVYEMNVDSYLRDRLKNKEITHEEYVKKIKDAQEFLKTCYAEKEGDDEKKLWEGISGGGDDPTLTPSSGSDMEIAEFLFYMQTYNCYENIARAFDVEKDEKGKPFFKSREDASKETLINGGRALLKLGWRRSGFDTDSVTDESGIEHFTVTCNPLTDREKNLVNSDFFTPMDRVLRAFDIEKNEEGELFLKSKESAIEEDIGVAKIALKKIGWIEDLTEERTRDASGKECYSVTSTPSILSEDKVILELLLAYKEKKESALISGKGEKEGTLTGSKSDEVGDLGGVGEADKGKKGKVRVGTGYGEGSDLFVDRVSEAKKLLSELETPNSETMADFFIDLCVKTTEKIKNDMLLIYQRTLDAVIREKSEFAKTLREYAFGDKDKNGAIDMLTEQIQKGDIDSAQGTLNRLTTLVDLTLKSDVDKKLASRSLKEIGKTLKDKREALDSGKISGDTLIKQLTPAFADLKVAVSNKRRIMQITPTTGHEAHTP